MKIVQVIPDFGLGGAETMCANLILELKKFGQEVIVVSLYNHQSPITERLEKQGVKITYLGKKRGFDLSVLFKLKRILKKEKPDVVHTHTYASAYGMVAAILSGVKKRVHTIHSIAQEENTEAERKIQNLLFKHHHVIPVALSGLVQKTIADVYNISKERIPVVCNGIDLSNCRIKENYAVDGNFKIVHVGRFSPSKNHSGLIKAFSLFHEKHQNSELWFIGDGPEKQAIETQVEAVHLASAIKFFGSQSDIYGYLHDADVFTLPSNFEGLPMTIIEAMGTGLPIVATSVGGIPDMLKNESEAILVENDPSKIAEAFERYYLSIDLREAHGRNAILKSKAFSSENMAKGYIKVYQM